MTKLFISLLLGLAMPWSFAMTIKGQLEVCASFAEFVSSTVSVRDAGIGWAEFEAWLNPALERSLITEGSYVQDLEDAAYVYAILKDVWESQDDAVMVLGKVYEGCMAK